MKPSLWFPQSWKWLGRNHDVDATFNCAYCGEPNDVYIDPTGGAMQQYVEDCQVCCRPNFLTIRQLPGSEEFVLQAAREGD